ncbi:MAG: hypothetical protein WCK46_03495 [Candidatus Adlerbacteria bacterium]
MTDPVVKLAKTTAAKHLDGLDEGVDLVFPQSGRNGMPEPGATVQENYGRTISLTIVVPGSAGFTEDETFHDFCQAIAYGQKKAKSTPIQPSPK